MVPQSHGFHYAIRLASVEAEGGHQESVRRAHLLMGICSLEKLLTHEKTKMLAGLPAECRAVQDILSACSMSAADVRRQLRALLGNGEKEYHEGEQIPIHATATAAITRAAEMAAGANQPVTVIHLFAALLEEPGGTLTEGLQHFGYSLDALRQAVKSVLGQLPELSPGDASPESQDPRAFHGSVLKNFGRDLTALAAAGKLGEVIGRRQEMQDVVRILLKKTKNNPVLVGDAGVGKTVIVEGLAQRIAAGKTLPGRRLVEINLGALIGGTRYRGDLEERVTRLLQEVYAEPQIILFIDEIHNLVGAGSADRSFDIGEMLKPALARDDFSCIGATTPAEYRRYIESDAALERRFEMVLVEEPSLDETIELLTRLAPRYEKHHHVTIRPEAIQAAVALSVRHMPMRRLPDKALDLLDTACAQARFPDLSTKLVGSSSAPVDVTKETIEQVVAARTGIPLGVLRADESGLENLEADLRERVVGQDEAVSIVSQAVRRARAGFRDPRKPQAVLLFLGPTGVGKTFLAQALAEVLFGSPDAMVRFDMSEFADANTSTKLLGAPPGYQGYSDEGMLTSRLRRHPYSVVLLDEMDKAYPRIWDIFLQLFDEGRVTDAHGRVTLAQQCIFILTANLPPAKKAIGFQGKVEAEAVPEEFRRRYRPEFLNRIDSIVVFPPLSGATARRLVEQRLARISRQLAEKYQSKLTADEAAMDWLAHNGISPSTGARGLDRLIARTIENPLTDLIFSHGIQPHSQVRVSYKGGDTIDFVLESDIF